MPADWLYGLVGGLLIGSAGALYLLINGRIMGASGILGGLIDGTARATWLERLAFLAALIVVPLLLASAQGGSVTNAISDWRLLVAAGILVGLGTRLAGGCTSGHGVCGISRLTPRGMVATGIYVGTGVLVITLLRHVIGGF